MSQWGLFGLTNPFVTYKSSSGAISKRVATKFFVTPYESKGALGADEFIHHL